MTYLGIRGDLYLPYNETFPLTLEKHFHLARLHKLTFAFTSFINHSLINSKVKKFHSSTREQSAAANELQAPAFLSQPILLLQLIRSLLNSAHITFANPKIEQPKNTLLEKKNQTQSISIMWSLLPLVTTPVLMQYTKIYSTWADSVHLHNGKHQTNAAVTGSLCKSVKAAEIHMQALHLRHFHVQRRLPTPASLKCNGSSANHEVFILKQLYWREGKKKRRKYLGYSNISHKTSERRLLTHCCGNDIDQSAEEGTKRAASGSVVLPSQSPHFTAMQGGELGG